MSLSNSETSFGEAIANLQTPIFMFILSLFEKLHFKKSGVQELQNEIAPFWSVDGD
jgi:hypothetical protein